MDVGEPLECAIITRLVIRAGTRDEDRREYYLKSRTHLSLDKDAPVPRPVASHDDGDIVAIPHLGGLHHRYERRAA